MTADVANDVIVSKLPDFHDATLSAGLAIEDREYEQIIRVCGGGNSATPVSAFNSSI